MAKGAALFDRPPVTAQALHFSTGVYSAQLGRKIPLRFDKDAWKPAGLRGPQVQTLLQGEYRAETGEVRLAPLLVKVPYEKGTIIFTSFHNETVNSEVETKLLKYLVFSAVTSQVERQMKEKLVEGGFAPSRSTLITATPEAPSVAEQYESNKEGPLRFVLGFNPEKGARLRLTVRSPDGKVASAEHESTFTVEVPNAPVGVWQYTVTAVSLPYPNFPFRVTVAEEK